MTAYLRNALNVKHRKLGTIKLCFECWEVESSNQNLRSSFVDATAANESIFRYLVIYFHFFFTLFFPGALLALFLV